jgi:hypothetical protein
MRQGAAALARLLHCWPWSRTRQPAMPTVSPSVSSWSSARAWRRRVECSIAVPVLRGGGRLICRGRSRPWCAPSAKSRVGSTRLGASAIQSLRESLVSAGSSLRNRRASSGRRGSCAGPAPSISAAIRRGRSRSAPVARRPSRSRSGRDPARAPRAEEASCARAAARAGRPPAPGGAACPG